MNENHVRIAIAVATGTVAVTLVARSTIKIHREEAAKRAQIHRDSTLDLLAITRAQEVIKTRINAGEIRSLAQLGESLRNEIDFQKIAIREEA